MAKTKVKFIDDSKPEEVVVVKEPKKSKKPGDDLIAQINAELGGTEEVQKEEKKAEEKQEKVEKKEEKVEKKKAAKPGKTKYRSKKYLQKIEEVAIDKTKNYSITEAIELAKKASYTEFEGTLEAHINTISTGIRGLVTMPFASGKKLTIVAFGKDADKAGADIIGDEALIEQIGKGKINFDLVVTSPDWMPKLAKVAKNLGPRGLMPNPKNGTITDNLKKAVEGFQAGKTEYKTEGKAPIIHISLGKINQPTEELIANIKALTQIVGKTRIKKVTLAPTMGPSVKVSINSL